MDAAKRIAKKIKQLIDENPDPVTGRKKTLRQIDRESGGEISYTYLSKIIGGKVKKPPTRKKLQAIADVFNISLDVFSEDELTDEINDLAILMKSVSVNHEDDTRLLIKQTRMNIERLQQNLSIEGEIYE